MYVARVLKRVHHDPRVMSTCLKYFGVFCILFEIFIHVKFKKRREQKSGQNLFFENFLCYLLPFKKTASDLLLLCKLLGPKNMFSAF